MALVLVPSAARAQEMPVSVDVQFSLFYRILSYDRDAGVRTADGLVIGVIFQGRFGASNAAKQEALRQRPPEAAGYRVRFVPIDLDAIDDLGVALREAGVEVVYVAPLRAVNPAVITNASRAGGVLTMTGVPGYVELGLGVGVGARGDRPEILVNLGGSRAEGASFSAQLLRLARVL